MDFFVGTILPVGFNFAPRGWMKCEGQTLQISQYQALFSLLGVQYGGDGRTTFSLPDLRCRTLVGAGQSPSAPGMNVVQGQQLGVAAVSTTASGSASVTLDAAHMPKHNHTVSIAGDQFTATSTLKATGTGPGANAPAEGAALGSTVGAGTGQASIYVSGSDPTTSLNANSVTTKLSGTVQVTSSDAGGGPTPLVVPVSVPVSVNVVQPSLGMNYIICVEGIYPTRN